MIATEKTLEQLMRFRRNELTAHPMPGETPFLAQQNSLARPCSADGRGATCRSSPDDSQIVAHFHAMIPMRNK